MDRVGSPRTSEMMLPLPATPFAATTSGPTLSNWSVAVSTAAFFPEAVLSVYGWAATKAIPSAWPAKSSETEMYPASANALSTVRRSWSLIAGVCLTSAAAST